MSAERLHALLEAVASDDRQPLLPAATFAGATFSADADFAGVTFAAKADFTGVTFCGNADFDWATFKSSADFSGARFGGGSFEGVTFHEVAVFAGVSFVGVAVFGGATFGGIAGFDKATFGEDADFAVATFDANAVFREAQFGGNALFAGATFSANVGFDSATFSRGAGFDRATFNGNARFDGASLSGDAGFAETLFSGNAGFAGVTFRGQARFAGATVTRDAFFARASFERAREFGPLVVGERLMLDDCVFAQRVSVELGASRVSARATTFAAGTYLRVLWGEIALDDADFARPSTLLGAIRWRQKSDLGFAAPIAVRPTPRTPRPRLITLRGAHVAELSLSDIDLRACRFFGAHGLESLSIEASCRWPRAPATRRNIDRETIAEEHHWRSFTWDDPTERPPDWLERRGDSSWDDRFTRAPEWLEDRDDSTGYPLQPTQIAALYRALRKAREEDRDEAGAGDLYYGEMEMRRHSTTRAGSQQRGGWLGGDRAILLAYWLVSGYGLRPRRALATLALTLLTGAVMLWWFGFHEVRSPGRALLFAIESSVSLLRPPAAKLSAGGEIIQITLRLLGPLLVGLVLLAIRARIKR